MVVVWWCTWLCLLAAAHFVELRSVGRGPLRLLKVLDQFNLVHQFWLAHEDGYPSLRTRVRGDGLAWVEIEAGDILDCDLSEKRCLVDVHSCALAPRHHSHVEVVPVLCEFPCLLKCIPYCRDPTGIDHSTVSLEGGHIIFRV